jgi:hypothetical protein
MRRPSAPLWHVVNRFFGPFPNGNEIRRLHAPSFSPDAAHKTVKKRIDLVWPRSIAPAGASLGKSFIKALFCARSCLVFWQPGLLRQLLRRQVAAYSLVNGTPEYAL